MGSSRSVKSQVASTISRAEEKEKVASEAEKRDLKAKREALRTNKACAKAVREAERLGRILKEAKAWVASKCAQAINVQAKATKMANHAQASIKEMKEDVASRVSWL